MRHLCFKPHNLESPVFMLFRQQPLNREPEGGRVTVSGAPSVLRADCQDGYFFMTIFASSSGREGSGDGSADTNRNKYCYWGRSSKEERWPVEPEVVIS